MLRRIVLLVALFFLGLPSAWAAIWPEEFYGLKRTSLTPVSLGGDAIWAEYGFEEGEVAEYAGEGVQLKATAWRFGDATAAMAVFQWRRPLEYKKTDVEPLAVESSDALYLARGNYILHFEGKKPSVEELAGLFLVLPLTENSTLPSLPTYLPEADRVPGSERFILGPVGLRMFEPRIPPSVAGFQYSPEAQLAKYKTEKGEIDLAIFSYPTPHIARERLAEFRMLPRAVVKRTGPMLVAIFDPAEPDEAQQLLAKVNYRATIVWDEGALVEPAGVADLLLGIFALIGVLLVLAIILGLAFGGSRFLYFGRKGAEKEDPMILLHLEDR
jgi:hypothetical protein